MKRLLKKVMALCLAACAITPLSAKSHTETQLDSLIANHKLIFSATAKTHMQIL